MASRETSIAVIQQLHEAQARLYAYGDPAGVRAMVSEDIAWHIPGRSPIAGSYRGADEVIDYMLARRQLRLSSDRATGAEGEPPRSRSIRGSARGG